MSIEAMKQALEALEVEYRMYEATDPETGAPYNMIQAITSLRQAIAEAEKQEQSKCDNCGEFGECCQKQEPAAWMTTEISTGTQVWLYEKTAARYQNPPTPLYTNPQPAQPKAEQLNEQRLLETFWRVVKYLGIEDEFLKNPKGKPSDVFIEAIKKREAQPKREPLTIEQLREHWQVAKVLDMTDAEIDFADYVLIARDVEALHGIKGEA